MARLEEDRIRSISPLWRGFGFVIIVGILVGGFILSGVLLERFKDNSVLPYAGFMNYQLVWFRLQGNPPLVIDIRGKIFFQLLATAVLGLLGMALLTVAYGMLNPPKRNPTDATGIEQDLRRRKAQERRRRGY